MGKYDLDTRLKLLAGLPLELEKDFFVYPLKLKEIIELGYNKYIDYLRNLTLDMELLIKEYPELEKVSHFELLFNQIIFDKTDKYEKLITDSISCFTKTSVIVDLNNFYFVCDGHILNSDNFKKFSNLLILQNCLTKEEDNFNPANERAKEIREKILQRKKKYGTHNKDIDFDDLVSSLSAEMNSINILNVWDLTMYQFENQFKRKRMIEEYEIWIKQMFAGVQTKGTNLEHYIRQIDK
jgi:hypothetical protein